MLLVNVNHKRDARVIAWREQRSMMRLAEGGGVCERDRDEIEQRHIRRPQAREETERQRFTHTET